MPALQSPWFVPHVTVYMFSYSVLGCAFIMACAGLARHRADYLEATDKLVYTGLAFLTVGMLTGAIWAKAAWGALLELGPQGDLGGSDMGGISALRPHAPLPQGRPTAAILDIDRRLHGAADVLVRGKLPSGGPAERPSVFSFLNTNITGCLTLIHLL